MEYCGTYLVIIVCSEFQQLVIVCVDILCCRFCKCIFLPFAGTW